MDTPGPPDANGAVDVAVTVLVLIIGFALVLAMAVWAHRRLRRAPTGDRRRALIVGAVTGAVIVVALAAFRLLDVSGF